jgi:hypothetical protein
VTPRPPDPPPYRPTSSRQRLLILVAAIAVAVGVLVAVLQPHVRFLRAEKARQSQDRPRCTSAQTSDCVGGTMGVITVPPTTPAATAASGPGG